LVWCYLLVFGVIGSTAQRGSEGFSNAEQFLGTWSGTWDGAGSGGLELTLEKGRDGAVAGRVAVTSDDGNYNAAFRTLSFDGKKMTAKYDNPHDERSEVVLAASFDGNAAKGTWSVRSKGTDNEIAAGNWSVTRK
jgi:hypothetical protein